MPHYLTTAELDTVVCPTRITESTTSLSLAAALATGGSAAHALVRWIPWVMQKVFKGSVLYTL